MEHSKNEFNVGVGVFLRCLQEYSKASTIVISKKTAEMLSQAVSCIGKMVARANIVELSHDDNVNFLVDLNEKYYQVRHNIMCRLCDVSIPISKYDLDAHVTSHMLLSPVRLRRDFESLDSDASQPDSWTTALSDDSYDMMDGTVLNVEHNVSPHGDSGVQDLNQNMDDEKDNNENWNHLIEVRGLPWTATRHDVCNFFKGVNILNGVNGVHFTTDDKSGRAIIQLEDHSDYQRAIKYHKATLGHRYIEVFAINPARSRYLVANDKIASKERVVLLDGLPRRFQERDVRCLLQGLLIEQIHLYDGSAYVKFTTENDVDLAVQRNDHKMHIRIYRSSEKAMLCNQCDEYNQFTAEKHRARGSMSRSPFMASTKFVKIFGIPWSADESYVMNLFPALSIDHTYGVHIETDAKNRRTGVAYVAFSDRINYEIALMVDLKDINPYLKVIKASKAEIKQITKTQ